MKPKFCIVSTKSIHYEADERSKTHPGHGYPAYTEEVQEFRGFLSQEALLAEIRRLKDNRDDKFDVYELKPVAVTTETKITLH